MQLNIEQLIHAAKVCEQLGITNPAAELPPLVKLADRALLYRRAVTEYNAARKAWADFSAANCNDDSTHDEHHRRVQAARQTLTAQDEEFTALLNAIAQARGVRPVL